MCGVSPADPDHLIARGFESSKRNDLTCIPLCRKHHDERGSIGNSKFEAKYSITLWRCVAECLMAFMEERENG